MLARSLTAFLAVTAWASAANAGDGMQPRLDGTPQGAAACLPGAADTYTLLLDDGAQTEPVHWRGRYYRPYYYGYRPYYYGYRPYYYRYRPYYYGYRPYYYGYGPYYRPYGYYYQPYGSFYFSSASVYPPSVAYYYSTTGVADNKPSPGAATPRPGIELPPSSPGDKTYPYDGGPRQPVPMPRTQPAPTRQPSAAPQDGLWVSSPPPSKKPTEFAYPAYGDERPSSFAEGQTIPVKDRVARQANR